MPKDSDQVMGEKESGHKTGAAIFGMVVHPSRVFLRSLIDVMKVFRALHPPEQGWLG